MHLKVITVATQLAEGLTELRKSCLRNKVELEIVGLNSPWRGFGTKIILLRDFLKGDDCTHFIFTDAYDTIFINDLEFISKIYENRHMGKIVFSTEKNCWPSAELASQYPKTLSHWKYLNSGGYMGDKEVFLSTLEKYPLHYHDDDQLYFTKIYLDSPNDPIILDVNCRIFQSVAFEHPSDFDYTKPFYNNITKTFPTIVHGNGRTPMDKFYNMI